MVKLWNTHERKEEKKVEDKKKGRERSASLSARCKAWTRFWATVDMKLRLCSFISSEMPHTYTDTKKEVETAEGHVHVLSLALDLTALRLNLAKASSMQVSDTWAHISVVGDQILWGKCHATDHHSHMVGLI